ncbi:MAG TPA: sulfoxide reductase heme-binding subunit YedZ [Methylophaga aminisulfidivorans]|nr:sulfoxide reductase heme-binding subunit YedZ [Methylophaga sp.]HEC73762.1 sulfoxide reductase heme-binding subunit YedZ [Methylophaga aminisulfidivorans]
MNILYIKRALFFICLTPLILLVWRLLNDELGVNPVETLTRSSGLWALRFLLLTLFITPLRWLTGVNKLIQLRRMIGLYAFFYALIHMLLYLGLDQLFDIGDIWKDILKRPFITIGFISFLMLLPLVATSTNKMMKRIGGKNWKRLHKLTYLVAAASCLHFLMLVKADIREPIIYIVILAGLFIVRLTHFSKTKLSVSH